MDNKTYNYIKDSAVRILTYMAAGLFLYTYVAEPIVTSIKQTNIKLDSINSRIDTVFCEGRTFKVELQ